DDRYLCPVQALAEWLHALDFHHGYIFQSVKSMDHMSVADSPIMSFSFFLYGFLEMFWNNLLDIGKDLHLYSCHSCRRGGAQWLAREKRWTILCICDWGGWSLNYNHTTILKYLFSWNDNPHEAREDFFNPAK
ncbi:hypothetical protein L208DRAFT_1252359, partial [Tricholoma matsutake]